MTSPATKVDKPEVDFDGIMRYIVDMMSPHLHGQCL